jgi:predicted  nucleic acid-binding Zn-ribbon protein
VQGLKDNITRLQSELADAQGREKELMTVVDKAIQIKDDVTKKLKAAEAKLGQSSGGNNSKVVALEKQLDEQKRQNKELSKKVSQLLEQVNGKAA